MSLQSVDLIHYFQGQINEARTHPKKVAQKLQARQFVQDRQFVHSQLRNIRYKTEEGQSAVDEAIAHLQQLKSVSKVTLSGSLCEAAYQAGIQMAKQTCIENPQTYSASIEQEIKKTGVSDFGDIWIIVEYGFRKDPDLIPSVIVDDGDPRRTRRDWLLNERTKLAGISVHGHVEYDYMLLILLTDRLEEGSSSSGCSCRTF